MCAATRFMSHLKRHLMIQADPPDNRILECAVTAKSNFIVSGDFRHVLPLGQYEGIPIVKVADFMEILQKQS